MKLNFLDRFSKKLKYKVSPNSVHWKQNCSMRTDGHDEADSRFSQFCERGLKNKMYACCTGPVND
jgi:hypothetical protein